MICKQHPMSKLWIGYKHIELHNQMLKIENIIPESRKFTSGVEKYSSCNKIGNKQSKDSQNTGKVAWV